jgi:hypothetical protein
MVGPAGFEPTTFTQKPPDNGSLRVSLVTLQNFVILRAGVSKPIAYLLKKNGTVTDKCFSCQGEKAGNPS